MLVEQELAAVTVFRRTAQGFVQEAYRERETIPLPEIGAELPLTEIYGGVKFEPEPADDEI